MENALIFASPNVFEMNLTGDNMSSAQLNVTNTTITTPRGDTVDSLPAIDDSFDRIKDVLFMIQYVLLPFFLVVGLFGNIFTIITMASKKFAHLTSRYILICLALSDSVLLVTQPFNKLWIIKLFGQDYRALSSLFCKAFFVIFKSSKMTSSWLVVFLCFERFVAVVYPLKARSIIRKRYMFTAIALDYILMLVYNSVWSFSSDVVNGVCKPDIASDQQKVFVTIGSSLYSFIPTVLLMIFTPQIMVRLVRQRKLRLSMSTIRKTGENVPVNTRQYSEMRRASVMVLCVMVAYIILIVPVTFVHLLAFVFGFSAFDLTTTSFFVFREIAQILEQINYAINFFIYVLCSTAFRSRVKEIVCFKDFREDNSSRTSSLTRQHGKLYSIRSNSGISDES